MSKKPKVLLVVLSLALFCLSLSGGTAQADTGRRVVSLDGTWGIAEGDGIHPPANFDHTVPVPGLVDMAKPAFAEVGQKSARRDDFWYHRTFRLAGPIPDVAILKIFKAAYGSRVFLNGRLIGDHLPSFTPGLFDIHETLRGNGGSNDLVIRVGAFRDSVPPNVPSGWDFEKKKYIPGLFDSVQVILSGTPNVVRVQAAPDIVHQVVRVQALIHNAGSAAVTPVVFTVREARSGRVVGFERIPALSLAAGQERMVDVRVPVRHCHLWSPEDPFLYSLETRTRADDLHSRFGMREFRLDSVTGRAFLNGHPYFMRGSNVTLYRFFEDAQRGDLPWNPTWVRRLHRSFKGLHWNCLRYCIGFPPEQWYDIADEEGFLIQDEFPLWYLSNWPPELKHDELAREYAEWMQERWNHPCVVLWDGQNETATAETGLAIQVVRGLDLSHRPWDNGWGKAQTAGDSYEAHPYHFQDPHFRLSGLAEQSPLPGGNASPNVGGNAAIVNEYGWLWLNRDGTPTTLTRDLYANLLGPGATTGQRRSLYARYMADETEFWRCHRDCAAVMQFCALGYSRPDGQTSDNFRDVANLVYEPELYAALRDAFAPTGLMIDFWGEEMAAGEKRTLPILVINDLYQPWHGTVRLSLWRDRQVVRTQSLPLTLSALDHQRLSFPFEAPSTPGQYRLEAALVRPDEAPVRSVREFRVLSPAQKQARDGIAVRRTVVASSVLALGGVTYAAANAVDGDVGTRWSSQFTDPQWLAVDLGQPQTVGRVRLVWEAAFAQAYGIQVSQDGQAWTDVFQTESGRGGTEEVRFPPVQARWVRLYGTKRATRYGYSLWEMQIFP